MLCCSGAAPERVMPTSPGTHDLFWLFSGNVCSGCLQKHSFLCSSEIPEDFLVWSPPLECTRDAGEAACALASVEAGKTMTEPIMSTVGLLSPVDAIVLTLTCLSMEHRTGLIICLARESRVLHSSPLVICSAWWAYVILHKCFWSTKTTFVICWDRLTKYSNIFWMETHFCFWNEHIFHIIYFGFTQAITEIISNSASLNQYRLVCGKGSSCLYLVGRLVSASTYF